MLGLKPSVLQMIFLHNNLQVEKDQIVVRCSVQGCSVKTTFKVNIKMLKYSNIPSIYIILIIVPNII